MVSQKKDITLYSVFYMKEVDTVSTPRPRREPSLQAARCDHNISAVCLCLCMRLDLIMNFVLCSFLFVC